MQSRSGCLNQQGELQYGSVCKQPLSIAFLFSFSVRMFPSNANPFTSLLRWSKFYIVSELSCLYFSRLASLQGHYCATFRRAFFTHSCLLLPVLAHLCVHIPHGASRCCKHHAKHSTTTAAIS